MGIDGMRSWIGLKRRESIGICGWRNRFMVSRGRVRDA
jgi:hypothetical protein